MLYYEDDDLNGDVTWFYKSMWYHKDLGNTKILEAYKGQKRKTTATRIYSVPRPGYLFYKH